MKNVKIIITLMGVLIFSSGINASAQEIRIGTQTWATKNLEVTIFRNGDTIPEEKTNEDWAKGLEAGKPAWCYYNYDPANGLKYGKLYNWYAVNDSRGLAPKGWHIPNLTDWKTLVVYLGVEVAGTKMKNTSGWNNDGNGTNASEFAALPGGSHSYMQAFGEIGNMGAWWSSDGMIGGDASGLAIQNDGRVGMGHDDARSRLSVRCLKD
jgi:uncharacterized protein (TIGR02145 family)